MALNQVGALLQSVKSYRTHNFGAEGANYSVAFQSAVGALVQEVQKDVSSERSLVARAMAQIGRAQILSPMPEPVMNWIETLEDSEKELAFEFTPQILRAIDDRVENYSGAESHREKLRSDLIARTLPILKNAFQVEIENRESYSQRVVYQRARITQFWSQRLSLLPEEVEALPRTWKRIRESSPEIFDHSFQWTLFSFVRNTTESVREKPSQYFLENAADDFEGAFLTLLATRGDSTQDVLRTSQLIQENFLSRRERNQLVEDLRDDVRADLDEMIEEVVAQATGPLTVEVPADPAAIPVTVEASPTISTNKQASARRKAPSTFDPEQKEKINDWARAYHANRSPQLREKIVEAHTDLVAAYAQMYTPSGDNIILGPDDLASEGMIGLLTNLESFDPQENDNFTAWALPRIKGAMKDALRSAGLYSKEYQYADRQLKSAQSLFESMNGRPPNEEELFDFMVDELEKDPKWVEAQTKRGRQVRPVRSSNIINPVTQKDSRDDIKDFRMAPASQSLEMKDLVQFLTRGFTRRDAMIFQMVAVDKSTMREAGEAVGLSESSVKGIYPGLLERVKIRIRDNPAVFGPRYAELIESYFRLGE
jgi:RNA polymerase sigma factor for flagellar operon FliA